MTIISSKVLLAYAAQCSPSELLIDQDYLHRINILCSAINASARLNIKGRKLIFRQLADAIVNYSDTKRIVRDNPEVLAEKIKRPILLAGLPRTGSTFLQRLLSLDPDNRYLNFEEGLKPCVEITDGDGAQQRSDFSHRWANVMHGHLPAVQSMITLQPDFPVECNFLKRNSLLCDSWCFQLDLQELREYWYHPDSQTTKYQLYLRQLQILQYRSAAAERWVLKSPTHHPVIDSLDTVFEQPLIINTRRNLDEVVPSLINLVYALRKGFSDHIELSSVRDEVLEFLKNQIACNQTARKKMPDSHLIDIDYPDLIQDPQAVIEHIYARFNLDFTNEYQGNIESWLQLQPQSSYKPKSYRYNLRSLGFSVVDIHQYFDSCFDSGQLVADC
ncbi:sulfotransferase [Oceanicoccus sp. KOV_DT_Chl]|uniref:sulfotransferase family protein n=1 Tax=Oceanicoccus sp. KOV_DT_Chl TaxID=1904639 RepID=UPI00135C3A49|nr:sulfotransferase [Oceanicoccus sp. KOV_DT_Chl]